MVTDELIQYNLFNINTMKHLFLSGFLFFTILLSGCNQSKTDESGKESSGKKLVIGATMLSMQNEFVVNVADEMEAKA